MVEHAPQIDFKFAIFFSPPALTEVRTGSVNAQANDASLLNQPSAFHEEPSLGLCPHIIKEGSVTLVTLLKKMSRLVVCLP